MSIQLELSARLLADNFQPSQVVALYCGIDTQ